MREFNTTGPCDPTVHYTVMRPGLLAQGRLKVDKGRFFTIFAPRQTGKTTYFQLLLQQLAESGRYTPLWVNFENLYQTTPAEFYEEFGLQLNEELSRYGLQTPLKITNRATLEQFFRAELRPSQPVVLVIDEFEGTPATVLSELMHTFRKMYHRQQHYNLHALILVGVSTLAELVVGPASPFNIADELPIPYFTAEETQELIQQYVTESGQPFDPAVIEKINRNTTGQPGLVCALCHHLVTQVVPDKSQTISLNHFYQALDFFLTRKFDKNIMNIVQKARQKRDFMLKVLFPEQPIPFTIHDPDVGWLFANGVVDETAGAVDVVVPLYKKVIITAFRPLFNGESTHYVTSAHESMQQYLTAEGELNINALLTKYRAYVRRRGFRAFDTETFREAAWHYSLDGFLNFFIEQLGGQTFVEIPSGRGRVDILIRYRDDTYLIETKRYTTTTYFKQGKAQLATYLKSEALAEGYYVVFSDLHTEEDQLYSEEVIEGKRIYSHIILINFARPSDATVPAELKT